ncbi:hypothetical protein FSP39_001239 [Pinctada imbricata]|uniref:Uncharacterized protein n=1 Tax=Pinctada imbricata TaxID=66713 RepID=A0AA88YG49_PINIB|nr:hypothetical protein FSP39_001239 [Pinctada imbricata]
MNKSDHSKSGSDSEVSPEKAQSSKDRDTSGNIASMTESPHEKNKSPSPSKDDRKRKLEPTEEEIKAHKHKKEKQEEERLKMQWVDLNNP